MGLSLQQVLNNDRRIALLMASDLDSNIKKAIELAIVYFESVEFDNIEREKAVTKFRHKLDKYEKERISHLSKEQASDMIEWLKTL